MPPEVFGSYDEEEDGGGSQKQAVTQAVDIYSFGLVLWQLVTGEQLDKSQGSLRQPRWVNIPTSTNIGHALCSVGYGGPCGHLWI